MIDPEFEKFVFETLGLVTARDEDGSYVEPETSRAWTVWQEATRRAAPLWTPASTPPDADTTVLLALTNGEVWQGYWDGGDWIEVSGLVVTNRVKYWQHTPAHPEDRA